CGRADQGCYCAGRWDDSTLTWSHNIWIGGDETRAVHYESDGSRYAFNAIRGCLSKYHVVGIMIGQCVANVMERCCQPRLPDDECTATRVLKMEELRGRQRGCENGLRWHFQSHEGQPHLQVTLGELGV